MVLFARRCVVCYLNYFCYEQLKDYCVYLQREKENHYTSFILRKGDMNIGRFITLAVTLLLSSQSVRADCIFTSELDDTTCVGNYTCYYTLGDLKTEVRLWGCRQQSYGFSGYRQSRQRNYVLNIIIENLEPNYDLSELINFSGRVITVTLNEGITTSIPNELFLLTKLLSLDVSHNQISIFELSRIEQLDQLHVFNVSFNSISELQEEDFKTSSNLAVLDLSHNAIPGIPENYFKKLPYLLHLNMSHNEIKSFSILTFEGLADLETLHLSYNNIKEIGMSFARFQNLTELFLDHNELTSIEEINFKIMSKLVKLNLSFNKIISIDDLCFQNMISLVKLKLNDNMIKVVSKSMLINNNQLQALDLSNNNISKIESYSFKGKYITQLSLHDNSITGMLDKSIFVGINADIFDLSGNNITSLGPNLFTESKLQLKSLNFSINSISDINYNTFRSLGFLNSLDLSKNRLLNLHFDFSDLSSLTIFKVGNNFIETITKETFSNIKSLKEIDLSNNCITVIDTFSFKSLKDLQSLDLSNNQVSNTLASNTFTGLSSTRDLNLTYSKITTIEDGVFYEMTSLLTLNVSHGELQTLNYNAFNNTGSIWTLDLSYNRMETFLVNNMDLGSLTELYLNDNQIKTITNQTFAKLNMLQHINLSNNNILRIENGALTDLNLLFKLILSSNVDMMLDSSIFSNSSVSEVSMHNVWKPFDFVNAKNSSILQLELSSCNITDINTIKLVKLAKLEKLLLNSNKISIVNEYSFQNLSKLYFLDLSDNLITFIKPGSFINASEINVLNLSNNNLQSLQFGIFDGLAKLQDLNLSCNSLHTFSGNIFHNSHRISGIYLDNNMIDTIDLQEIASAGIPMITIGYNLISCDFLVKSKKNNYFDVIVTSEIKEFQTENIDGISCKGLKFEKNTTEKVMKLMDSVTKPFSGSFNPQIIVDNLGDLKSVLYFEASCLLVVVALLVTVVSLVYFKLRSKLVRSYSLSSRRHLTASSMEMEL